VPIKSHITRRLIWEGRWELAQLEREVDRVRRKRRQRSRQVRQAESWDWMVAQYRPLTEEQKLRREADDWVAAAAFAPVPAVRSHWWIYCHLTAIHAARHQGIPIDRYVVRMALQAYDAETLGKSLSILENGAAASLEDAAIAFTTNEAGWEDEARWSADNCRRLATELPRTLEIDPGIARQAIEYARTWAGW